MTSMPAKEPLWTKKFITITLVNLLLFFGFQLLIPTLPVHVKNMGADDAVIGWVTGLFTLSALMIRPVAGWGLDRFGRRGIFLTGLVLFVAVTAAYSFLPSVGLILLLRFIHGFGWGAASTTSNTVASDVIPKKRFGEGIGFFTLAANLAMAVAPAVGLTMIVRSGFRPVSFLSAGLVALSLLLAFGIRYEKPDPSTTADGKLVLFEPTAIRPAAVMFFVTVTYGAINSFIALYAMELGIANVGSFFTVMAVAMLVSRPLLGTLMDRRGFRVILLPALVLTALALYLVSAAESLPLFLAAGVAYGTGFGALQSGLQAMSVLNAPRHRLGVANSTFYFGFDSGIGFGSIILGMVAARFGYSRMFFWSIVSVVIALILYLITEKKDGTNE